ncbi:glycosyltransferase [Actinocorallia sp. A-T 12471]|uniref:glycosyltransferase n=1 Tax=Actinocorallia sp. A-T 12471 TaxID=3089813 RepID=UPI0029D3E55B|nr:glycosyltransferase [Actinocorallia sp. A-T 12471]MDX6739477.1 glycosyltransferase [Actinocorallia sp. A-T 12471]
MRIVQLANLYSPVSGGLRTAVDELGRGYAKAGHERFLVLPGPGRSRRETEAGTVITVPGPSVAPGYRLVLDPRPVLRALDEIKPDSVEVSDKATLTVAARWARRSGARSVLFSHERLDAILAPRVPSWVALDRGADLWNRRLAGAFDTVVATSEFSAAEFRRIGAPSVALVPLGVDLTTFRPRPSPPRTEARLVLLGRLSKEKRPGLALAALRELLARGHRARLDVIGGGSLGPAMRRAAVGLPVRFHGHLGVRGEVAGLLAAADVALATCPVESFGLAVLEALACGTPVVCANAGAAPELIVPGAGEAAPADAAAFADAIVRLLALPEARRRAAARARAERYPWTKAVHGLLNVHGGGGD